MLLIDLYDDKYIMFFDLVIDNNNESIGSFVKNVFVLLSDSYNIDLRGYYSVDIYCDVNIGMYVEVEKIDDYVSLGKKIDTKVSFLVKSFCLRFVDLASVYKCKKVYQVDNYWYVKSDDYIDNYGYDSFVDNCEKYKHYYKDVELSA